MTQRYPKRKDFIASHQRLVERRRKDDIAALRDAGPGALSWVRLADADLGTGVSNGYPPDPLDSANLAYAYDQDFLYLRGRVLPNSPIYGSSGWVNTATLFTVPLPAGATSGTVITNGNSRSVACSCYANTPGQGVASLSAKEATGGPTGIIVRGWLVNPWSLDVSNNLIFYCDVQFPLG